MSFRVLIVFASSYGQTHRVADAIAKRLRDQGAEVDVHDVHAESVPSPDGYDVVGLGSHVRRGKHDPAIHRYVDQHLSSLLVRNTFFFSVSLTAANKPYLRDPGGYISDTILATAWRPDLSIAVAGALPYRDFNAVRRVLMKLFSSRRGQPVDTHRNYVFTDWSAVRDFADKVAQWRGAPLRLERALGARARKFS